MFSRLMDRGVWYTLATGFKLQLYLNIATPNYISAVFFQPAVMAILTGLIFTVSGKTEHLDYAVVGAGMFGVWNSNLYASAGIIQGERRFGTLEFLATTRSPLFLVILGKTMGAAVFSLFSLVVSMAVMAVAFQYRLHVANGWVFLLSIVVSMITVTVVGLLLSSLSVVTSTTIGSSIFSTWCLSCRDWSFPSICCHAASSHSAISCPQPGASCCIGRASGQSMVTDGCSILPVLLPLPLFI